MSVEVIFDGQMGRVFGKRRNIKSENTIGGLLRNVDEHKGGLFLWMRNNLNAYKYYRILCKYSDGRQEIVLQETLEMTRENLKEVRFTPIIEGAGGGKMGGFLGIILGVVLIATALFTGGASIIAAGMTAMVGSTVTAGAVATSMVMMGIGLALGGIVSLLTPQPKFDTNAPQTKNKTSYLFNGPENTVAQGLAVPLIYGRCLVGSHAISASYTVNDIIVEKDGKIKDSPVAEGK